MKQYFDSISTLTQQSSPNLISTCLTSSFLCVFVFNMFVFPLSHAFVFNISRIDCFVYFFVSQHQSTYEFLHQQHLSSFQHLVFTATYDFLYINSCFKFHAILITSRCVNSCERWIIESFNGFYVSLPIAITTGIAICFGLKEKPWYNDNHLIFSKPAAINRFEFIFTKAVPLGLANFSV